MGEEEEGGVCLFWDVYNVVDGVGCDVFGGIGGFVGGWIGRWGDLDGWKEIEVVVLVVVELVDWGS